MKIVVGSESERKIETTSRVLASVLGYSLFKVMGCAAPSGVPETPWGEETREGAYNRAIGARRLVPDGDYFIGLESGLTDRYGDTYEEAWCCVIGKEEKDGQYYGYSSGLKVPKYVIDAMANERHAVVMARLEQEHAVENAIRSDTWSTYSGGLVLREVSIEEAARNAFVQAFPSDGSFYLLSK